MLEHQNLSLEARINVTGAADACTVCGSNRERTPGMTETYVAGTELCVCPDCADGIDAELARFAYDPASRGKQRRRFQDDHFGVCPECGGNGGWKNIGRAHWVYCERHGLKWWVGENLVSSWREETEADWIRNEQFLARLREIEPYLPEPTLFERIQVSWQAARDAWLSYELNERLDRPDFYLEGQIHDLERLRDIAADQFGQECELFRQIDEALKNGAIEEIQAARQRFIEEAYDYLPPDVAPF